MKRILSIYLILLIAVSAFADGIGKWTLYPSYKNITNVAFASNDIFAVSSGNLFSYNRNDGSLQTYTKNDVLSDNRIRTIAWAKSVGKLLIAYESGIIDILSTDGDVSTITDIANKTMTADKSINNIYISGQYAYLSMGFGVLKINVKDEYIVDTYNLGVKVTDAAVKDGFVYALTESGVMKGKMTDNLLDKSRWQLVSEDWNSISPNKNKSNANGTLFLEASTGSYWGNNKDGKLTRYEEEGGEMVEKTTGVAPDGPYDVSTKNVQVADGKVFVFPGGWGKIIGDGIVSNKNVSILENGEWRCLDFGDYDNALPWYGMHCITIDPRDNKHWMFGAKTGIYEFYDQKFVRHYGTKNGLESITNDDSYCIITDLYYDRQGTLWMGNLGDYRVKRIPSDAVLNEDYQIQVMKLLVPNATEIKGFLHDENSVWFVNSAWYHQRGLYEYDLKTSNFNKYESEVNQDNTHLAAEYNYLSVDSEKTIWIASTVGLLNLPYSERGNTDSPMYQHKVPRNDGTNFADYLLGGVDCNYVAIDKNDNKWVGTNGNGIYYISKDNNTEIYHFTTENSPIPSDIIFNISIDEETGKVYFATENGLCSFQSDVRGKDKEVTKDNVYAYPNPVTPDYKGYITIIGLYADARVKILTSSGIQVCEGIATGGSYRWNGRDSKDSEVASGVYYVMATDSEGNESVVTKVAIVR